MAPNSQSGKSCMISFSIERRTRMVPKIFRRHGTSTFRVAGSTVVTNRSLTFTITTFAISHSGTRSVCATATARNVCEWGNTS